MSSESQCKNPVTHLKPEPEKKPCKPGKERDPITKRCRKIKTQKVIVKSKPEKKPCKPGKERDPITKRRQDKNPESKFEVSI